LQATNDAKAQSVGSIIIDSDGSVIGTSSIHRNGDVYTLIGNLSAGIQVQRSNIIIDGDGYTIQGTSGYEIGVFLSNNVGQDPSRSLISNVTIKNLKIINCYYAIDCSNTNNNTFIGNYIENCDTGFWIIGSSNNTLMYNTVKDCATGISINYSGFNIITENNIINNRLSVWLSTEPYVDMNYWSDYLTKYPNAKEIEKSGLPNLIWDTPYNYGGSVGNSTDNHPLINPITSAASPTATARPTTLPTLPTPSSTPIPTIVMIASLSESASALNFGNSINFTVSVEGGTAPYSYAWYLDDELVDITSSPYYSTDKASVGSHHIYVEVRDANNNTAQTLAPEFNVLPSQNYSPTNSPSALATQQPTLNPSPTSTAPEFPAWIVLPLAMVIALMAIIVVRKKQIQP
jgi:parallel beta-helix repeat protein